MQRGPPGSLDFNHSQQVLVGDAVYMQIDRQWKPHPRPVKGQSTLPCQMRKQLNSITIPVDGYALRIGTDPGRKKYISNLINSTSLPERNVIMLHILDSGYHLR